MLRMMLAMTLAGAAIATQAQATSLDGVWMRSDGKAKVHVGPCGGQVCAINEWIKPGTSGEKAGDKLIMSLQPEGRGEYAGTANDPQRGLTYKIKIDVGKQSMTTRGCVLAGLLCKSVAWSRLSAN